MKDLNFFSIYQSNVKERKDDNYPLYVLGAVVVCIILAHVVYTGVKFLYIRTETNKYIAELEMPETKQKLAEAELINEKLGLLRKYNDSVVKVDAAAKKVDVVTDNFLIDISKSVPKDMTFTKWSSKDYELTIEGTSTSRASVAEFVHNIKQYSYFETVHVDKLEVGEFVGDDHKFKITCVWKEGE